MSSPKTTFRAYLVLARASNLPTVWSNCLAGWLIGGGGDPMKFGLLCLGATLLYTGGMFLNDAFDADFDRHFRPERPIPSGAVSAREVWRWGINFLILGTLLLAWMSVSVAVLTLILVGCILLYDAIHKVFVLAPVIMAFCRLFLVVLAAAAAQEPLEPFQGLAVWSAIALAFYIVGLSYLARNESRRGALKHWAVYFLATPIFLALVVNDLQQPQTVYVLCALLIAWVLWCLRHTYWSSHRQIGRTVSGLLAGIVLVDLLAVANQAEKYGLIFGALFVAARLFQKFIPAT